MARSGARPCGSRGRHDDSARDRRRPPHGDERARRRARNDRRLRGARPRQHDRATRASSSSARTSTSSCSTSVSRTATASRRSPSAGPEPDPAVLVISSFKTSQYVAASSRFGASRVPAQDRSAPGTRRRDPDGVHGRLRVHPGAAPEGLRHARATGAARSSALAMDGLSNKEIGARLGMSPKTVESRLTEIYDRFGITGGRDRALAPGRGRGLAGHRAAATCGKLRESRSLSPRRCFSPPRG